jgi:hypothetical protein
MKRPHVRSASQSRVALEPLCRQNTIGSVEGELRRHEIWESRVDALLKLDRATKNQTSNDSHGGAEGVFPFQSTGGLQSGFLLG